MFGWGAQFDAIGDKKSFATATSACVINNFKILCSSNSPVRTNVSSRTCSFFVPTRGAVTTGQFNGDQFFLEPGKIGAFAPAGNRIGSADSRSTVILDFDPLRLRTTASAMFGVETGWLIDFSSVQQVYLEQGGVKYLDILMNLCGALDNMGGDANLLNIRV